MRSIKIITPAFAAAVLAFSTPALSQGGCSGGMCGMEPQSTQAQGQTQPPMSGMHQGQNSGGMNMQGMMGGCPMMKQMASLQERVRMMEDMMGMTKKQ